MERLLLKPHEAAHVLGVARSTIYQLLRSGRPPSTKIGKARRIPYKALEQLVEELVYGRREAARGRGTS